MKYNILGYYGRKNNGDDALQLAIKKLLGDKVEDFICETGPNSVKNVVLGGGDVIKDFDLKEIDSSQPIKILGAGLGYPSEVDKLKNFKIDKAFFRNKNDVVLAHKAGIDAAYTPDLVFGLDVPAQGYTPQPSAKGKKLLGLMMVDNMSWSLGQQNRNHSLYFEYFKAELVDVIKELYPWYKVVFIPMSHDLYAYDVKSLYEIQSQMKPFECEFIEKPLSALDTIKLVSHLDLLLTMRFHGCIYATLAGTPFVNIGQSRKTHLFCLEHGLSDLSIPPFTFAFDEVMQAVKKAERSETPDKLKEICSGKKEELAEVQAFIDKEW